MKHSSTSVSFAGVSIRIDYRGRRAAQIVSHLFGDMSTASDGWPHTVFSLEDIESDRTLSLQCGRSLRYHGRSLGEVSNILIHATLRHVAEHSASGLVLHSGAVAVADRCLLLPGASGSGKTTLTAWLTAAGLRYLTDELAYVPQGSNRVDGFTQPLNIKTSSLKVLRSYVTGGLRSPRILATDAVALVPAGQLRQPSCKPAVAGSRLSGIIFPSYRPEESFRLTPLSQGQVGLRLMACVLNARNLANHGFDQVAQVAGNVAGHEMRYASLQQVEAHLDAVLSTLSSPERP